jgi:hypothetical protein
LQNFNLYGQLFPGLDAIRRRQELYRSITDRLVPPGLQAAFDSTRHVREAVERMSPSLGVLDSSRALREVAEAVTSPMASVIESTRHVSNMLSQAAAPALAINQLHIATITSIAQPFQDAMRAISSPLYLQIHPVLESVAKIVDRLVPAWWIDWGEPDDLPNLPVDELCEYVLAAAQEQDRNAILLFTTDTLGLHAEMAGAVMVALADSPWRESIDPLTYLREWAKQEFDIRWSRRLVDRRSVSLSGPRKSEKSRSALTMLDVLADPRSSHPFDRATVVSVLSRAKLSPDAKLLLMARGEDGCGAHGIYEALGWDARTAERVRKELQRKLDELHLLLLN